MRPTLNYSIVLIFKFWWISLYMQDTFARATHSAKRDDRVSCIQRISINQI